MLCCLSICHAAFDALIPPALLAFSPFGGDGGGWENSNCGIRCCGRWDRFVSILRVMRREGESESRIHSSNFFLFLSFLPSPALFVCKSAPSKGEGEGVIGAR